MRVRVILRVRGRDIVMVRTLVRIGVRVRAKG